MQNGNNRYTVIVNGDCTVTVSFISTGEFEKAVEEMRQALIGENEGDEHIGVKASIISGQGVFGDCLVAENEHKNWANALSTALHAGTDENTIAEKAIEAIKDDPYLISAHKASLDDAELEKIKNGNRGDYLCIYKYRDAEELQAFVNERFSGLQPSDTGTNTYQLYVTIASVNDTNYAMIVLHGAYIGISGSETNSTQRLL